MDFNNIQISQKHRDGWAGHRVQSLPIPQQVLDATTGKRKLNNLRRSILLSVEINRKSETTLPEFLERWLVLAYEDLCFIQAAQEAREGLRTVERSQDQAKIHFAAPGESIFSEIEQKMPKPFAFTIGTIATPSGDLIAERGLVFYQNKKDFFYLAHLDGRVIAPKEYLQWMSDMVDNGKPMPTHTRIQVITGGKYKEKQFVTVPGAVAQIVQQSQPTNQPPLQ